MSQTYGTIDSAMVTHPHFRALPAGAKLLALYLRACDRCNLIGAFYYPMAQIADDLDTPFEGVSKGFQSLSERDFARYCEATRWVFIPKHMHRFPVLGLPKVKHAIKLIHTIPREFTYMPELLASFDQHHDYGKEKKKAEIANCEAVLRGMLDPLDTPSKGVSTTSTSSTTSTTSIPRVAQKRGEKDPPYNPLRDTTRDYSGETPTEKGKVSEIVAAAKAVVHGAAK